MSSLRTELESIYRQHRALSPALVVDTARPKSHPLHDRFQWDDAVAAEQHRLAQAAELIRSVRIVYKTNTRTGAQSRVRAYVSTGEPDRPSAYLPTDEAMADPITRELVLRQFERAIIALKRQYSHLKEYDAMVRKHGLGDRDAA